MVYADSSALVKLVIEEPESDAVRAFIAGRTLITSALAEVEVLRAIRISRPEERQIAEGERLLSSLELVDISREVLRRAAELASLELRTLDAIHLATIERVGAHELLTYDRRLAEAAGRLGLRVVAPR